MRKFVSYDLETHLVQPGLLSPPIVCGSVAHRLGSSGPVIESALLTKKQARFEAQAWLLSNATMTGMNIAYDFGCLAAEDPSLLPLIFDKYKRGEVHDVGIAMMLHLIALGCVQDGELIDPHTGGKLVDPGTGKIAQRVSLASCTYLCLGRKDAKRNDRFRLSYALLEGIPMADWPEDARQYPIDDAVNGLEVAEWQHENCRNLGDLAAQCETAWGLHLSSMYGVRTNPAKVKALELELTAKRELDVTFAQSKGWMREDGSKDTKKIKAAVDEAYQGMAPKTDGGATSCAREVLESSGDPDLERFSEVSNTERRLKTYLPVLQHAAEAPLNVRPNILLANGRVSYDGIIQTMERKGPVRQCFEARPGTAWSSVDWSAAEMSGLAEVCVRTVGESKLAEVLQKKMDPHALFAAEMSGATYEDFVAKLKTSIAHKDLRQATKTADFGFNGMMGAFTFVLQKRKEKMDGPDGKPISIRICQLLRTAEKCGVELIQEWKDRTYDAPACKACVLAADNLKRFYLYRMWPEMPKYFNWITAHLDNSDELEQFVSGRVRGGLKAPAAANTLFSGLVADMAKWALRKMTEECYLDTGSPLFGSRIALFAHDETILEIPNNPRYGTQTAAALRQAEIHKEAGKIYCPVAPPDAEPALMTTWYKDAKAVWSPDKKTLLPWSP